MKKRVLVTGLNSYVGNSFASFCANDFEIDKVSLKNDGWRKLDFSKYDSILHVAGIAHTSKDPSLKELYYKVNTDLTFDIAQKAKHDGVKQFIFMSSIIIYGDSAPIGKTKVIDENSQPNPNDFYGDSKLQAEKRLAELAGENFKIAVIRPPMIYGEGSKGNYPKLVKLAKYAFIFPYIENQRSVLHIGKLSQGLKDIVENEFGGIFMPQDDRYFCTSEFIKEYRKSIGKKTYLTRAFNPFIKLLAIKIGFINKVFGSLIYKLNP
ncbi:MULTISPECIES: NAD-dependent epimerase/dehydratase family protein [unclassified Francisella]|uniref:NAD-dependent epimerase/dehydratase family protein n=1 Tax=unclassified Francisella TaxID=2610885 RepID=UPI002E32C235|nr:MULTISPECIES: NAD-dependent epimerase/dehydratase family protein [unclassified Francisella]MED7819501.1 NAD-dependent epimerase/dehydratase family protein [Francisella sp. 19S2-4]MED7830290.1 NAD-dependent epimerase/dehydratase family protein [Francisella sp. 19S2-10]